MSSIADTSWSLRRAASAPPTRSGETKPLRHTVLGLLTACLAFGGMAGVAAAAPVGGFSPSETRPVRGQTVTFTATDPCLAPVVCLWSGDDGVVGEGRQIEHAYPDLGSYQVTLAVDDPGDDVVEPSVDTQTVTVVNRPPTGAISVSEEAPLIGQSVSLTAITSDADGDETTVEWSLDDDGSYEDGSYDDGSDPVVNRAFLTAGEKVLRLRISDGTTAVVVSTTITVGNRLPTGSIQASSSEPLTAEDVSFTATGSDPDGGDVTYSWDLDGDGRYGDATGAAVGPHRYAAPGAVVVSARIFDDENGQVERTVGLRVQNRSPLAAFDWSPAIVRPNVPITLSSRAVDPEGFEFREESWDLDGDGAFDDAFGPTVTHTFTRAGVQRLGLRVVDQHGAAAETRIAIVPNNQPPEASFTASPDRPAVGTVIQLVSSSSDPDGSLAAEQWDLDGDGEFDDASGRSAEWRIEASGAFIIALKVTDDAGGSDVVIRRFEVASPEPEPAAIPQPAPAPVPPAVPPPSASPSPVTSPRPTTTTRTNLRMLKPFPSVRIAGRLTSRGAVFSLVRVQAPPRTRVSFSCRGGGCPRPSRASVSKTYRLDPLRGAYRAGAVIEIRVTRRGFVGKYTRLLVNRGKAPSRRDLCLFPSSARPRTCPS